MALRQAERRQQGRDRPGHLRQVGGYSTCDNIAKIIINAACLRDGCAHYIHSVDTLSSCILSDAMPPRREKKQGSTMGEVVTREYTNQIKFKSNYLFGPTVPVLP